MSIAYRPEIDGLRALAVLPVILFHGGFAGFGGGLYSRTCAMFSAMRLRSSG